MKQAQIQRWREQCTNFARFACDLAEMFAAGDYVNGDDWLCYYLAEAVFFYGEREVWGR